MAEPILTEVEPHSIASEKSSLIPIESVSSFLKVESSSNKDFSTKNSDFT